MFPAPTTPWAPKDSTSSTRRTLRRTHRQSGTPTILDYELYGVKPFAAGVSGDPGAANEYNGALVNFDDAYNVELYALLHNGALDPNAADFFGSSNSIGEALAFGTASGAAADFYNDAIGDLSGFFQTNLTFLDIPGF